jgi:hypothetical protein
LTDAEHPISVRDIERLNGWLKMANISYLGSNKNAVVEGSENHFDKLSKFFVKGFL